METLAAEELIDEGGFEMTGRTLGPGEVAAFLDQLGGQHVGVHVRGGWGSGTGRVDGIAFADVTGLAGLWSTLRG